MPGWLPWAIAGGAEILNSILSSKKQGEANQLQDKALQFAERDYASRLPLRNAFKRNALKPIAEAPNLSSIFVDAGNPFASTSTAALPHVRSQLDFSGIGTGAGPGGARPGTLPPPTAGPTLAAPNTSYTNSGTKIGTEIGLSPGGMDSTVPGGPKPDLRSWEMRNAELEPSEIDRLSAITLDRPKLPPLGPGRPTIASRETGPVRLPPPTGPTPIVPPLPLGTKTKTPILLPSTSTLDRRLALLSLGRSA
jgi:hypothetical protein